MAILDDIRRFWDDDAATYDDSPGHRPTSPAVQAAWTAALEALLPPAPARVLDCGAGTGFLSLMAARLGHRVTALDLSPQMLAKLRAAAEAEGLDIAVVVAPAHEPPPQPPQTPPGEDYDAVMERHLLWTLPDPVAALAAWRKAAPGGRLVAIESLWGDADPLEALRGRAWKFVDRRRGTAPDHHGPYPDAVRGALPLGTGTHPRAVAQLVAEAGWAAPRLVRLRDVEWATTMEKRLPERLLGVTPRFAVVAT
jgi:SAM-dependent methyltransferase